MLSMSFGLRKLKGFLEAVVPTPIFAPSADVFPPDNGIPSTTNNGLLLDLTELAPRIRMSIPAPGSPLLCEICTPAVLPCINCSGDVITPWLKSSEVTAVTEPVASLTVVVP